MKQLKLNLPVSTKDTIDIVEINPDFPGIILGLKDNEVIGVILYGTDEWYFLESIYSERGREAEPELYMLINLLIGNKTCDSFNVIVFGE